MTPNDKIAVIGLDYIGLLLAVEFGKRGEPGLLRWQRTAFPRRYWQGSGIT
jgi:hypothetical protein